MKSILESALTQTGIESIRVIAYTDGACKGNPGIGGWGVFMQLHDANGSIPSVPVEFCGGEWETTNNRMELVAAIRALEALSVLQPRVHAAVIHSDSQYVVKGLTEWIYGWIEKDFHGVKNADLWKILHHLNIQHSPEWRWVRGHSGNHGNEQADCLANAGVAQVRAGQA